jgi:hypothetical protein
MVCWSKHKGGWKQSQDSRDKIKASWDIRRLNKMSQETKNKISSSLMRRNTKQKEQNV